MGLWKEWAAHVEIASAPKRQDLKTTQSDQRNQDETSLGNRECDKLRQLTVASRLEIGATLAWQHQKALQ